MNPTVKCMGCDLSDDHPKHVIDVGGVNVRWHYGCHATATNCEICQTVVQESGGLTGEALRDFLTQS